MLSHAHLPLRLWDAAVLAAYYVRNRMPILPGNKTPFEANKSSVPKMSHLKVWGCICYVLIQSTDPKRYKLLPTFMKGIFIWYSESASQYRVYIPSKPSLNKVIVSANVKFLENSFWDWKKTSTEQLDELRDNQTQNSIHTDSNQDSDLSSNYSSDSESEISLPVTPNSAPTENSNSSDIPIPSPTITEITDENDNLSSVAPIQDQIVPGSFGSEPRLRRSE